MAYDWTEHNLYNDWDSEREEEASYERLCRMERMMGA